MNLATDFLLYIKTGEGGREERERERGEREGERGRERGRGGERGGEGGGKEGWRAGRGGRREEVEGVREVGSEGRTKLIKRAIMVE